MKAIGINTVFACLFNLLLCVSCGSDGAGDATATTINSLASLKAAFDNGDITMVDYKTVKQREILNQTITKMEVNSQGDTVNDLPHIKITSKADNGVSLRVRLTLEEDPNLEIVNGVRISVWAETIVYLNGSQTTSFKPFAIIIDSEITSTSLNTLDDTLQVYFR